MGVTNVTEVNRDEMVLLRVDHGGVATLTLNRPKAYNALSEELLAALQSELNAISNDPAVRVVVIEGSGTAFCAGHDLKQMRANPSREYYDSLFNTCSRFMLTLMRIPQPVIAKVHGIATAAGCQLVSSCDLAIASNNSQFATPGVNIGLFCSTPMVAVSRNVNRKNTMEMLLLGEFIPPSKAKEIGLINKIVSNKDLKKETIKMAQIIALKSPATIAIGKEAFYKQLDMTIEEAYKYTSKVMTKNMLEKDAQEGISAFIENRDPKWSDR